MAEDKKRIVMTVGVVRKNKLVLLGLKLRGLGEGLFNGPGGHLEEGEDTLTCFRRETKEESGLIVGKAKRVALIDFEFSNEPGKIVELHVFETVDWVGEFQNTEEMIWQWFATENIPYDKMWEGDRYWLEMVLNGKIVRGRVLYDNKESRRVIDKEFCETE